MTGLLDFNWHANESGYESVKIKSPDTEFWCNEMSKMFGVDINLDSSPHIRAIDENSPMRNYNLSEHPALFREFAQLPIGEDEPILQFANKYGLLTAILSKNEPEPMMTMWMMDFGKMAICIKFLDYIRDRNLEGLKENIIEEEGVFKVRKEMVNKLSEINSGVKPIPEYYFSEIRINGISPPRNYFEAAYHFICDIVNITLHKSLGTALIVNPQNTGVLMRTMPNNLLSALWLQFSHAATRNIEYKQCAACSIFFEVKSKKRRFEKIYCSDKCRKRVSARKRREKEKAK